MSSLYKIRTQHLPATPASSEVSLRVKDLNRPNPALSLPAVALHVTQTFATHFNAPSAVDPHIAALIHALPDAHAQPAYERHIVTHGEDLDAVAARYPGVTPAEIAAANAHDLKSYRLAPGQSLIVPGAQLRSEHEFARTVRYHEREYLRHQTRYGKADTSGARHRPELPAVRVSPANYQQIGTDTGFALKSTAIHLNPHHARLQDKIDTQHQQELAAQAQALPWPEPQAVAPQGMPNLGNTADGGLVPMPIDLDAQTARQRASVVHAYAKTAYAMGPTDRGRWGNTAAAAWLNYSAGWSGAHEAFWGLTGNIGRERNAAIARQSAAHRANQHAQMAKAQGMVGDYRHIKNSTDFLRYIGGTALNTVPYLVDIALGAATGGALWSVKNLGTVAPHLTRVRMGAGAVSSYPSSVGVIALAQHEHSTQGNAWAATALGLPYAALNLFGVEGMAARLALPRNAIGRLDSLTGITGVSARAGSSALMGGLTQTGSSVAQFGLERYGQLATDVSAVFLDPHFVHELPNVAVGGFLVGAPIAGVGGGRRSAGWQRPQVTAIPEPTHHTIGSRPTRSYPEPHIAADMPVLPRSRAKETVLPFEAKDKARVSETKMRAHVVDVLLGSSPRIREAMLRVARKESVQGHYIATLGEGKARAVLKTLDSKLKQLGRLLGEPEPKPLGMPRRDYHHEQLMRPLEIAFGNKERAIAELAALDLDPHAWGLQHAPGPRLTYTDIERLSLTQITILQLRKKRLPYKTIATHTGIGVKSLRNYATLTWQELGVTSIEALERAVVPEGEAPDRGPQILASMLQQRVDQFTDKSVGPPPAPPDAPTPPLERTEPPDTPAPPTPVAPQASVSPLPLLNGLERLSHKELAVLRHRLAGLTLPEIATKRGLRKAPTLEWTALQRLEVESIEALKRAVVPEGEAPDRGPQILASMRQQRLDQLAGKAPPALAFREHAEPTTPINLPQAVELATTQTHPSPSPPLHGLDRLTLQQIEVLRYRLAGLEWSEIDARLKPRRISELPTALWVALGHLGVETIDQLLARDAVHGATAQQTLVAIDAQLLQRQQQLLNVEITKARK